MTRAQTHLELKHEDQGGLIIPALRADLLAGLDGRYVGFSIQLTLVFECEKAFGQTLLVFSRSVECD